LGAAQLKVITWLLSLLVDNTNWEEEAVNAVRPAGCVKVVVAISFLQL
jgi:hypothetical protein